jgi:hypothetical protein
LNALFPIDVTELGMIMEVKPVDWNAKSPIDVTSPIPRETVISVSPGGM